MEKLRRYDWPGNIREMQNVILRYLATGTLQFLQVQPSAIEQDPPLSLKEALQKTKREYIVRALRMTNGNNKEAAALLDLPLRTFQRYCSQMGLIRRLSFEEN